MSLRILGKGADGYHEALRAPDGGAGMNHAARLAAARAAMEAAEVDAMIVSGLVNIRYLTGFTGSNALVVIGPDTSTLLTDFRYQTASEPLREWVDVELAERDVIRTAAERLAEHLRRRGPGRVRAGPADRRAPRRSWPRRTPGSCRWPGSSRACASSRTPTSSTPCARPPR